jgi:hypothetical protein
MNYAHNVDVVVPNDAVDLPGASSAGLYVGVGGTLTVTTLNGTKVQMTVVAGLVPVVATRVWSTGTAATNIVSLRL